MPNTTDQFILDVDASNVAIGAELIQVQNGAERVIAYSSFSLTPEQKNYCTTRKELLAIVRFTRQFRYYLLGNIFTVRTDHSSLTWLLRFKELQGQLARWIEELSQYHMVVKHRAGIRHGNADALSRIPDPLSPCSDYVAGIKPEDLPCGGCHYCSRAHRQWARFCEDIDEAVGLSKHVREATPQGVHHKEADAQKVKPSSLGINKITKEAPRVEQGGQGDLLDLVVSCNIQGWGGSQTYFDIVTSREDFGHHISCCKVQTSTSSARSARQLDLRVFKSM